MKHPLGIVALFYLGGLLLAEFYQPPLPLLFAVSLAVAAGAIFLSRLRNFLIWPLIVLTGWTNLVFNTAVLSPHDLRTILDGAYEDVAVRGVLCETPSGRVSVRGGIETSHTLAQLDASELRHGGNWRPSTGRIVVFTPGALAADFFAGQRVEISGIISYPQIPVTEGLFDYRTYLRRQGVYFQLRVLSTNDWQLLEPHLSKRPVADRFLAWAQRTLAHGLPVEDQPLRLLWAMTLGWRSGITNEIYEPFMQSGTMHIFAISGLHIALIAGILVAVLRVAQVSRFWCGAVVIPLIWFYTGATGWQPSAIRSTIMMSIIVGGWALKRPSNLLNSLAAAAFIILLWQPQQLFQASFQLSFFVVLSIALFAPPLQTLRDRLLQTDPMRPAELLPRWQRLGRSMLRWTMTAVVTSLAAWLGSWPLTAYYFHMFSPVTLLANLLIVPLSSAALACNIGSLICGGWLPWIGELFNHAGWFWMWLMMKISHWSAALPGAFFFVPSPALADFAVYYALLFGTLSGWFFVAPNRKWLVAVLVLVASFYFWRWHDAQSSVTITAIPLNGGSSVFCDLPGHERDLLVNCGNTNAVMSVMKPFLRGQGVNSLSRLLLTHGDLRNIGGTEPLCAMMRVDEIVTSNVRFRSPTYRRILRELPHPPESWQAVNRSDRVSGWTVLHPEAADKFPQADDSAVVLQGEFNGTRVLLLSDLGRPGQNALMERNKDLRADIVIAGLPDQGEPLCDALIEAAQPKVIVVTDSERPATKRANAKLRTRLERHNIPVLYTRNAGAVKFTLNPRGWELQTAGGQRMSSDNLPAVTAKPAASEPNEETTDAEDER